jgi:hypothetical protein
MSTKKHLGRIIGLAIMATLAVSAFVAATASAHQWTIGGQTLSVLKGTGTANGVGVTAELEGGTTAKLKGTLLGKTFVLTSTTVDSDEGTIFQEGNVAKDSGILTFSGLTVDEPAGCAVESPIKTKPLTTELVTHKFKDENGTETTSLKAYDKFFPEEGEVFATIKVTGCAVAGSYNVKGVVYGEAEEWGVEKVNQPLNFSPAINATLGGSLTLGSNAAELTASGTNHLIGALAGSAFGAEKTP